MLVHINSKGFELTTKIPKLYAFLGLIIKN